MTITSIEQAKKRMERVNIFLDNEFWVGLDKNQLIDLRIHKGLAISEQEKKSIEEASGFYKLIEKAVNFTIIRPRSKFEIYQYLTLKKEVEEETANKVTEYLEEKKFLSDDYFADWYIKTRTSIGFHGNNKIYAELLKKGISKTIIKKYFAENVQDNSEKIIKLYEKIQNQIKAKSQIEKKYKIYQRILSRGFTFSEVDQALKEHMKSLVIDPETMNIKSKNGKV